MRRGHKFNAVKTEAAGRKFDSKHEAAVAVKLLDRQEQGEVRNLRFQVKIELKTVNPGGTVVPIRYRTKRGLGRAASHTVDFVFEELVSGRWVQRMADAKGMDPQASRLRRAVVETMMGTRIDLL